MADTTRLKELHARLEEIGAELMSVGQDGNGFPPGISMQTVLQLGRAAGITLGAAAQVARDVDDAGG